MVLPWVYNTPIGDCTIIDNHCCAVRLSSYPSRLLTLGVRPENISLFLHEDCAERERDVKKGRCGSSLSAASVLVGVEKANNTSRIPHDDGIRRYILVDDSVTADDATPS
jgi:hypothetical protein